VANGFGILPSIRNLEVPDKEPKKQTLQGMFELSKQVLQKVSFDRSLFKKELGKAINWIKSDERLLLKAWCLASFGHLYKDMILEAFEVVV